MRVHYLWRLLALLAVCVAAADSPSSLRQAADHAGLLISSAVRAEHLSESAYRDALAREFNMLEPEDAMKWWVLHPAPKTFDFRQGDAIVQFARTHGMKVRGHCLVWGRQNPDWLTQNRLTPRLLSELLHDHIRTVMQHYSGRVFAWDVVNEALDENGAVRNSIWYDQPGIGFAHQDTSYIEEVFRWARDADPNALLFYNEAEAEDLSPKSDAIYRLVKNFRQRGVPIDGVGLQMHITNLDLDVDAVAKNIFRLAALGVQVHITELDVAVPVNSVGEALHPEDLLRQAEIYHGIVRACLSQPACTAVQTWGFTDKYSWIRSSSRGSRGLALPLDRSYGSKAAYRAILEELSAGRHPPL